MKKCIFAGTFDPPTKGHVTVIDQCLQLFDEVVVAVMVNTAKTPQLSVEERQQLLHILYGANPKVRVRTYEGPVVRLLEEEQTPFYVRGVRDTIDFAYENRNFYANKKLKQDIITLYVPAPQEELEISSTLVRNSVVFQTEYDDYLPSSIVSAYHAMVAKKN